MSKENKTEKKLPLCLIIADSDNSLDAAFRIFKDKEQVFYASTRLNSVKRVDNGYLVEGVDQFVGLNYELKKIASGKITEGTVTGQVIPVASAAAEPAASADEPEPKKKKL